jgi:putative Mg2+ transporter-C (MgtC) family protein
MGHDELVITGRVLLAIVLGGLIGMERTFHGRAAGFRTHALVCLGSALLMMAAVFQGRWMTVAEAIGTITSDPTRTAQGIMTGIGFLGAGVIFKEGLTVRGLTTAASIWVTAAIGIVVGIGFYFVAVLGAVAALVVLALFLALERRMPAELYMYHQVCFSGDAVPSEDELRSLIASHGLAITHLTHSMRNHGKQFEYRMTLHGRDPKNAEALSRHLRTLPGVIEFRISPTGD